MWCTVHGVLRLTDIGKGKMTEREYKGRDVEVKGIRGFSIGDGPIAIWAPGKAGWFEIRPAQAYQRIFSSIENAIDLYYTLTDIHSEAQENYKGKGKMVLDVDQVFRKVGGAFRSPTGYC